jgi:cell division protein FtsB
MVANFKKSKKRSWPRLISLISLMFLAIGLVGFLIVTNWRTNQRRAELQEKRETLISEVQVLEEQVANLRAGIIQTETDDYQTEKLYEEGYFPTGSVPVVVLPPEEETAEKKGTTEEKNPWQKFLEVLGF